MMLPDDAGKRDAGSLMGFKFLFKKLLSDFVLALFFLQHGMS